MLQYIWIPFLLIAIYFILKGMAQNKLMRRPDTLKLDAIVVDSKAVPVGGTTMFYPVCEYELDGEAKRITCNSPQATIPTIGTKLSVYYNKTDNKIIENTLPAANFTLGVVFAAVSTILSFLLT
jgi:hypothetical protein